MQTVFSCVVFSLIIKEMGDSTYVFLQKIHVYDFPHLSSVNAISYLLPFVLLVNTPNKKTIESDQLFVTRKEMPDFWH